MYLSQETENNLLTSKNVHDLANKGKNQVHMLGDSRKFTLSLITNFVNCAFQKHNIVQAITWKN
jgi:hypothetical protein